MTPTVEQKLKDGVRQQAREIARLRATIQRLHVRNLRLKRSRDQWREHSRRSGIGNPANGNNQGGRHDGKN